MRDNPSRAQWLRRLAQRRRDRVAFVFSGGGPLGALQVGQLKALLERDVRPELAVGTSVGALNAAFVAFEPTLSGVHGLEQRWKQLKDEDLFPGGRFHVPWARMLRRGTAVYDNSGIRRIAESHLGAEARFEEAAIPLGIVATDLETGDEKVFTSGEVMTPLLASSSMPSIFPPVEIDGRLYTDGGVSNNVPIAPAVTMGGRTIYVLDATGHGHQRRPLVKPLDYMLHAFTLARFQRLQLERAIYAEKVRLVMLPATPLDFYVPFASMAYTGRLIDEGYEATRRFLDGRAEIVTQKIGDAQVEAVIPAK